MISNELTLDQEVMGPVSLHCYIKLEIACIAGRKQQHKKLKSAFLIVIFNGRP